MSNRLVLLVIALLLAWLLAACGRDPRNDADAYRIRLLADQQAASLKADRDIAAVERQLTTAARVAGWNRFITWASVAACVLVVGLSIGASWAAIGSGRALAKAAEVKAYLIPLPESTRQFPLMLAYLGGGRFSLANPNTSGVMLLDSRSPGDRQMIAAAGAVQLAGTVAREARRSREPEGVSIITSGVSHVSE
jgi:hypothetical protein